jgi:hypothetical protein
MSLAKITLFRPKLRSVTVPALTERLNKEQQAPQEVMHEEKRNLVHPCFAFLSTIQVQTFIVIPFWGCSRVGLAAALAAPAALAALPKQL